MSNCTSFGGNDPGFAKCIDLIILANTLQEKVQICMNVITPPNIRTAKHIIVIKDFIFLCLVEHIYLQIQIFLSVKEMCLKLF